MQYTLLRRHRRNQALCLILEGQQIGCGVPKAEYRLAGNVVPPRPNVIANGAPGHAPQAGPVKITKIYDIVPHDHTLSEFRRLALPSCFATFRTHKQDPAEENPMSTLEIEQIPTRNDNYVYLLRESGQGKVAVVDPSDAQPVIDALDRLGWQLTDIINTHHHNDHTGGNLELKEKYGCVITGPLADHDRIAGIDVDVADGDTYMLGDAKATVYDTPGHTRGHIAYWFDESKALFCGDTLFALGCGRTFEGTADQMWNSLSKLRALPDDTMVYCAHEYTQSNAKFAITIESGNQELLDYAAKIDALRAADKRTVPSLLGLEKSTNPFLRADVAAVGEAVGLSSDDPVAVFAEVRLRKDNF
jgi:hydroxyacylglutathione hydrolase